MQDNALWSVGPVDGNRRIMDVTSSSRYRMTASGEITSPSSTAMCTWSIMASGKHRFPVGDPRSDCSGPESPFSALNNAISALTQLVQKHTAPTNHVIQRLSIDSSSCLIPSEETRLSYYTTRVCPLSEPFADVHPGRWPPRRSLRPTLRHLFGSRRTRSAVHPILNKRLG